MIHSKYWANITRIFKKQQEKGIKTYGQILEDNADLTAAETLVMLQEELIDALMYIEKLKERM